MLLPIHMLMTSMLPLLHEQNTSLWSYKSDCQTHPQWAEKPLHIPLPPTNPVRTSHWLPEWGTVLHSHHPAYTAQSCSYCLTTWMLVTSKYGSQVWCGRLIGLSLWLTVCTKTYRGVKMTYFRTINKEKKCILKRGALLLKLSILSGVLWEL